MIELFALGMAALSLWGIFQGWAVYVADPALPLYPMFIASLVAGVVLGIANGLIVARRTPRIIRLDGAFVGLVVAGPAVFLFALGDGGSLGGQDIIDRIGPGSALVTVLSLFGFVGVYGCIVVGTWIMGYVMGACLAPDGEKKAPAERVS